MSIEPISYAADVQSPFQAALQGYQAGAGIRNDQLQQQQQQLAIQQQKQQAQVIRSLITNPNATADDYANATLLVPGLKDQFKQAWETKNAQQQQNDLSHVAQVFAALKGQQPDVAAQLLTDRATALRGAGDEAGAKNADVMAQLAKDHPEFAASMIGMKLAAIPGGDKVITGAASLGAESRAEEMQPEAVKKAQAEAQSAAVAAKFAESNAAQDLVKKGWDIQKIQSDIDIAKQNVKIAAMNASIAREGNDLKRQELGLKLQEMKDQRDEKVRTRVADVESARSTMDNFLSTADKLLTMAVDKDGKPTDVIKSATGPIGSRMPTTSQDTADFEALAETLGSQAFMSQIPAMRGTGNLSEREGDKLQSSLQNLSLKQSPERLIENVKEAQRLILKARKNVSIKYGVPDTVPDTPAATATPNEVDALIKKYAGGR